jgi:hypothetical protein
MKKISLLALLLCFSVFPLYAQFEVLTDVGNPGAPLKANTYPEVKGTAYIVDFEPGFIVYTKKDTLKNISIRFNAYGNMLEYKHQGVLRGLSTKDILGFVLFSNGRPQYFSHGYDLPNLGKDVFVQVLSDGKYTLLNYRYKIMADDPAAAYGSQRSKMFQNKNDFFIATEKGVFPMKTKRKQFVEIFGEDAAEVNKILSANYYDLKNETDLARVLELINSL